MGLFGSLFKSYSEKQIKKIMPIADKIEALSDKFASFSDGELREYTDSLKMRLRDGSTLDDILPEAFALVREADWRVLGKRPFRVQLLGGILIHQGRIAEMRTGEGKTLVATMPAYLNALSGKGVHIVTVNDYLAQRDSEEMGKVFSFLGLTTGLIVQGQTHQEKKIAYSADITYGTNNELGFDYLRDNMAIRKEDTVQRGHSFAIIDEVDSILIDEARTPLIISGRSTKSTEMYKKVNEFVRGLSRRAIKEYDPKKEYDIDKDYFSVDDETGKGALYESCLHEAKKLFDIQDGDFIYDESYATVLLSDSGKDKLTASGCVSDADFVKSDFNGEDGYLLTKSGVEKCEAYFNRNFNMLDEDKGSYTLTYKGAKKLISFFDFKESHFLEVGKDKYRLLKEGAVYAKEAFSLSEKDFTSKDEGKTFGISIQGVERINSLLSFDYFIDEKGRHAILAKRGIDKAERYFKIENLSSPINSELQHHISIAIRAHGVMKRDVDYIVRDGAVLIVDSFTGRLMPGRRYNDGLHQAIEAKEGVAVQEESQTVATITFQNYFRLYSKLSGMTGTALTEDNEFREIYALDVVEVPTNKPMIRKDYNDAVYRTRAEKLNAIVAQIKLCLE